MHIVPYRTFFRSKPQAVYFEKEIIRYTVRTALYQYLHTLMVLPLSEICTYGAETGFFKNKSTFDQPPSKPEFVRLRTATGY
jgi:hypothetical protein